MFRRENGLSNIHDMLINALKIVIYLEHIYEKMQVSGN